MARRGPLFVDRLVATIPVPSSERDAVRDRIPDPMQSRWRIALRAASRQYRWNYKLALTGNASLSQPQFDALDANYDERSPTQLGGVAYISCVPVFQTQRFLRLEFSPDAAGSSGRANLRRFLELMLGDSYSRAMGEARITRVDVGFDLHRQHIRDLAIAFVQGRRGRGTRVFTGADDELESIYNPASGEHQLVVYDKTRELNYKARKAARESGVRRVPLGGTRTRFEYRWRKEQFTWRDLTRLDNPFMRYEVREYRRSTESLNAETERFLFDATASRSLEKVLHSFVGNSQRADSEKRQLMREAYGRWPSPAWWNPSEIWRQLPDAIRDIGLYDVRGRVTP